MNAGMRSEIGRAEMAAPGPKPRNPEPLSPYKVKTGHPRSIRISVHRLRLFVAGLRT